MNRFLSLSGCFVILLVCSVCSMAQTKYRVDITLQGPWILYKDMTFEDKDQKPMPVLIVIAPGMSNMKAKYRHQPPTFGNGDAYWIKKSGIYCVLFDDKCAEPNPNATMSSADYPDAVPLGVKVPAVSPDKWRWYQFASKTPQAAGIYLILPMPDSYSDDGVWPMQFAPQSDKDQYPGPYGYHFEQQERHSIGIQLHYTNLTASTLSLIGCDPQLPKHDSSTCTKTFGNHPLLNTGALRITMKAPNIDNRCDPHVRAAYREMLRLLDSTDLDHPPATPNVNQNIAFVDPARDVDDNEKGVYDDTSLRCRAKYDPRPLTKIEAEESQMSQEATDVFEQAISVVREIDSVIARDPELKEKDLYLLSEIQAASDKLNPDLPNVAQFEYLADVIRESEGRFREPIKAPSLAKIYLEEKAFILNFQSFQAKTKGPKDCLASIMMVKQ